MVRSSPVSRAGHSPAPAHEKEAPLSKRLSGDKVIRLNSILSFLILLDFGIYFPAFCPLFLSRMGEYTVRIREVRGFGPLRVYHIRICKQLELAWRFTIHLTIMNYMNYSKS